jgi:hypothetical protein
VQRGRDAREELGQGLGRDDPITGQQLQVAVACTRTGWSPIFISRTPVIEASALSVRMVKAFGGQTTSA